MLRRREDGFGFESPLNFLSVILRRLSFFALSKIVRTWKEFSRIQYLSVFYYFNGLGICLVGFEHYPRPKCKVPKTVLLNSLMMRCHNKSRKQDVTFIFASDNISLNFKTSWTVQQSLIDSAQICKSLQLLIPNTGNIAASK